MYPFDSIIAEIAARCGFNYDTADFDIGAPAFRWQPYEKTTPGSEFVVFTIPGLNRPWDQLAHHGDLELPMYGSSFRARAGIGSL